MTPKKCKVCGDRLRADGCCRWRCDPALKRSVVRSQEVQAKRKAVRARIEAESTFITEADRQRTGSAVASFDPIAAHTRAKSQRAARRRWR